METRINKLELKVIELEAQLEQQQQIISELLEQWKSIDPSKTYVSTKTKVYGLKNGKVVELGESND